MRSPASGQHAESEHETGQSQRPDPSAAYVWLTTERLSQIRGILLGLTLFVALAVWVLYSWGFEARYLPLAGKLKAVGVMTWVYALVQILDHRFWNSRFAQRRRAMLGIPESLFGWLLGQMLAWFGIVFYALTGDANWYIAGLVLFVLSFVAFPIQRNR